MLTRRTSACDMSCAKALPAATMSEYVPISAIWPPAMKMTVSAALTNCSWLVTSTRVLAASSPIRQLLNTSRATCGVRGQVSGVTSTRVLAASSPTRQLLNDSRATCGGLYFQVPRVTRPIAIKGLGAIMSCYLLI